MILLYLYNILYYYGQERVQALSAQLIYVKLSIENLKAFLSLNNQHSNIFLDFQNFKTNSDQDSHYNTKFL